jgi:plasmid stabilization system protein ParE
MEEGVSCKPVEVSVEFMEHREDIYDYSLETFGQMQAERYLKKINDALLLLPEHYLSYPPCRHIPTKTHKYRNVILDAHLLIYRVTNERIEVLDIVHQASGISKIRKVRSIRL